MIRTRLRGNLGKAGILEVAAHLGYPTVHDCIGIICEEVCWSVTLLSVTKGKVACRIRIAVANRVLHTEIVETVSIPAFLDFLRTVRTL